jgi:ribosomal protein S18 acetylase RimI-like enzyme
MVEVIEADDATIVEWTASWRDRLHAWYGGLGAPHFADSLARAFAGATDRAVATLVADGERCGQLAIFVGRREDREATVATVIDLWVDPAVRGRGYGRAAREFAERWSAEHASEAGIMCWSDDPALIGLYATYPVRYQRMIKAVNDAAATPEGLTIRPMRADEYAPWLANEVTAYAADLTDSGTLSAADAAQVSIAGYEELLPDGLATPGSEWAVVEADRLAVATIWVSHDLTDVGALPGGLSFVYSVETVPGQRGRGYGRAAMLAGEAMTARAGNTHLALNVFGHNNAAIRLYDKLGYRVLDQSRSVPSGAGMKRSI